MTDTITRTFRVLRAKSLNATGWGVHECQILNPEATDPLDGIVPLVGEHGALPAQAEITAIGEWVDSKFGTQFKAQRVVLDVKRDERSLTVYLSSLPEVGPYRAREIVKQHGAARVLDSLDAGHGPSLETLGLPATCAAQWQERLGVAGGFRYLAALPHLDDQDRAELLEALGPETEAAVTKNAFRAGDRAGWSFKRIDSSLRAAVGMAADDRRRLIAAVEFALAQEASEGHVWSPATAECMSEHVSGIDWPAAFDCARRGGAVRFGVGPDGEPDGLVALQGLARAESYVAEKIRALVLKVRATQFLPDTIPAHLTEEQRAAVSAADQFGLSVLTGGPGCGKTAAVNGVLALARARGWSVALAAPTAKAAARIKEQTGVAASTIHRLLKCGPGGEFEYCETNPLPFALLVLDESSMIDVGLFASVLEAINPDHTRLLIVGDPDQLPSIGPGRVLWDLLASDAVPVTRLTKIFRQAGDSPIPHAAAEVRTGAPVEFAGRESGLALVGTKSADESAKRVIQSALGLQKANEKTKRRAYKPTEIQVIAPQRKGPCGVDALNRALQSTLFPAGRDWVFIGNGHKASVGDRVIHTKNEPERAVFNGDQGVVHSVELRAAKSQPALTVDFGDGRIVGYTRAEARRLDLAFALTVHKMQGSQAPAVVFVADPTHSFMLTRANVYTAITRAAEFVVVVGSSDQLAKAARNTRGSVRRTKLSELISAR